MTFPILPSNSQTGYFLTRSLRFRASASAYLSRTPASAGNRKTWTWSGWVKRGVLNNGVQSIFTAGNTSPYHFNLYFNGDVLEIYSRTGASYELYYQTSQVFRDPSAWYHFVLAIDTTQSNAGLRVLLWINGVLCPTLTGLTVPAQNTDLMINTAEEHRLSRNAFASTNYFDGYITEVNFIDGQALTPSSFGSTNSTTGVWQPAAYTGTYGTNGFYLPFTDNSALTTSSNVGLGKDFSGNGNYWVTNNISITAGATYDSMTDVPTLTSATAANYCVMNPLDQSIAGGLIWGNLRHSGLGSASIYTTRSTIASSSNKYYWEVLIDNPIESTYYPSNGITLSTIAVPSQVGGVTGSYAYMANGQKFVGGTLSAYGASYTQNDVLGFALDMDAGTLTCYKNNVSQGVLVSGLTGSFAATSSAYSNTVSQYNFGQRPFTYTPPSGFVALNTYNLPNSTILKGNKVMDATVYSGDGASPKTRTNAASFKPDLVWIKNRSNAYSHNLFDSVRGAGLANSLQSDNTNSEATNAINTALYGYLSAFNTNGFSTTNGVGDVWVNASGQNYVAWQWQAGQGSSSSNTSGTITSTVSVNASAGFSVVTYTGTGANATVGHGLGVAPALIIGKKRSATGSWQCWQATFSGTQFITFNSTAAVATSSTVFNGAPTSTIFNIGTDTDLNTNGATNVAYCWSEIAGYSKFGSYIGNGSADGVFIYTGLLARFLMIKRTDISGGDWVLVDTARGASNVIVPELYADLSQQETNSSFLDIVSNGFKVRSSNQQVNASGGAYIFAAFASNPFRNSLAR